jgi:putative colanic acid biosynthesis acetyltransferase WcaB
MLVFFRLAQAARYPFDSRPTAISYPATAVYTAVSEWLLGMELPVKTRVGPRLQIVHGFGLVVNVDAVLGSDVVLRQSVTIGNKGNSGPSPEIGDGVSIGSGACVLGGIKLGEGAKVGSNAVVLSDVPAGYSVVGNPGRLLPPRVGEVPR